MVTMILFAALAVVLGVGLGVLFNKLVIKNFPETGRKMNYVKTVIVFLLIAVVLFAAIYGKFIVDSSVKNYSNEIEQYMIKNHSNLDFVRNGLDITAVSKDISRLNKTVTDLNIILKPKSDELGIPNLVYNAVIGYVTKELQKMIVVINNATGKAANPFIDERNFLTVSSLINGFQISILKVVKTIVIVIVVICVILLGIYILVSLSTASKEKKRIESDIVP